MGAAGQFVFYQAAMQQYCNSVQFGVHFGQPGKILRKSVFCRQRFGFRGLTERGGYRFPLTIW